MSLAPTEHGAHAPARASTPHELARVVVLALGVAAPFVIGVLVGDRSRDLPLEPRYAWVTGLACFVSLGVLAQSAAPRWRRVAAVAALGPVLHLIVPGSALAAALDVTALLFSSVALASRAMLRIARDARPRSQRGLALAFVIALVPGPLFTMGWGLASTTLAPAATRLFHGAPVVGPDERLVSFASRDGVVIRGTYTPGQAGRPGVVLVHGLADSRRRLVPWARELASHGAFVLRIDLRAHGTSDGVALTFADREPDDVIAALRFLASQRGVGTLHLLGVSMGGGASLVAASRGEPPVASTVALAPASDFRAIVDRRLPPFEPLHFLATTLVRGVTHGLGHRSPLELTPADDVVTAGPARILVVHSRTDHTILPSLTERLVEHAPWVEVEWVDGVSHVEMPEHTLRTIALRDRVERFLDVR